MLITRRSPGKKKALRSWFTGIGPGLLLLFVVSGCSLRGSRTAEKPVSNVPTAGASLPSAPPEPAATPTPRNTHTLSVAASVTATPTRTPIPSSTQTASATASETATPTATPTLHPMSILAARQTLYPGSPITIVQMLEPGSNYFRYRAYYESDGLKIYGLLTKPFGKRPAAGWPAIVFNHGYIPPPVYRSTERYIAYVDSLARHGYVVFKIDYRGHDRSGGEATGAYGDPGYTTDVLNAVAALQAYPEVDAQRIGMWGHSMGGFLTLRAMVISRQIKAAVIWAGVVGSYPDMVCCWRPANAGGPTRTPDPNFRLGWRAQWQTLYGSPADNPEFWQGISANAYLADLSGPIQLHHDAGDTEVPAKFSQDLYQQIFAAGKTAEYYEYAGDDHNLAKSFTLAMTRTLAFFDRYLKGTP